MNFFRPDFFRTPLNGQASAHAYRKAHSRKNWEKCGGAWFVSSLTKNCLNLFLGFFAKTQKCISNMIEFILQVEIRKTIFCFEVYNGTDKRKLFS